MVKVETSLNMQHVLSREQSDSIGPIRTSINAYCIYYEGYRHLNSVQVVQAFTRDSIVSVSTGPSLPDSSVVVTAPSICVVATTLWESGYVDFFY